MKYQRFIPLITPLIIWLLSQAYLTRAELFYTALAVGALVITLSVKYISFKDQSNWPLFVIAPVLLFLDLAAYVAIIINPYWIQALFLLTAWFLFSYLKNLYYYFNAATIEETDQRVAQLDNLFMAGGFLTAFAAAAVWFALPAFLNWSPLAMLPALALVIALLFIQFSLFSPNRTRPLGSTAFIIVILLIESAWAFSWLPLNFNILALFLAISYYFGLTVLRLKWSGSLNRRALQLPLIFSAAAILILLLTARWL